MTRTLGLARLATAAAFLISPILSGTGMALHRDTPVVVQVTTQPSQIIGTPAFAYNSTVMVFHSDADLLGNGNTTPQIFLFDLTPRAKKGLPGLFQITKADQGSYAPTAAKRGRIIMFESEADLVGNGSVGKQLFAARRVKWRNDVLPVFQVTRGAGQGFDAILSGTGKYAIFSSTTDLNAESLAPGTHVYRTELRRLQKSGCPGYPCPLGSNPGLLLVSREDVLHAAIDRRGDRVAFASRGDAASNNCANGAAQVFLKDFKFGTTEQLTFGAADSDNPVFSRDGNAVFFESEADLLGNGNSQRNIFRLNLRTVPYLLEQMTFGTDGESTDPEPNGLRADRFFFRSTASLTNATPGTPRLFLFDERQGIKRLTDGNSLLSGHTGQFLFVGFASNADLVGNGNNQPQIFLVNAFHLIEPPPPSTPIPTATPTPTPVPGVPANIGLALLVDEAGDNGDNTLTTVIAATVSDFQANPVPDGTFVQFKVVPLTHGAVVSNGFTNSNPTCDVSRFVAKTGVEILNQAGVVHVCLTYPGAEAGTQRLIEACAEPVCAQGIVTLPLATNECTVNGAPCSDFNPCTIGDVCAGGTDDRACVGGSNEGAACAVDAQCPDLRLCFGGSSHGLPCATTFDCPDGGVCQLMSEGSCELINPPTCQPGTPVECPDDGNACTEDVCHFLTGTCGMPRECFPSGNPCIDDVCDPATGLCGIPNTELCDDGDPCTIDDVCGGGTCQPGAPLTCPDDLNPCTLDVCNPETGACGIPIDCVCPAP